MVSVSQCHDNRQLSHFANAQHAHHHNNTLTNCRAYCHSDQLPDEHNRNLLLHKQQHQHQNRQHQTKQQQQHRANQKLQLQPKQQMQKQTTLFNKSPNLSLRNHQTSNIVNLNHNHQEINDSIYESGTYCNSKSNPKLKTSPASSYSCDRLKALDNNHQSSIMASLFSSVTSGLVNSSSLPDDSNANGNGDNDLPADIKKVGFMRKLKTNRRKYFVLRLNDLTIDDASEATISYYDNEKKFRANMDPSSALCKGKVLIRDCFAIQRKNDHKHRHVIGIYTPSELLGCVCDDENDMVEWLDAFNDILDCCPEYIDRQLRDFEHIWQATIQRSGLVNAKTISGLFRFCLLENNLYIIKVDGNVQSQETYECPLQGVRRCGHSLSTFFLELGRSSLIGPGELWLSTDDPSSAQNMHEIILNAMSAGSEQSDDDLQRFRASSLSSTHRGHRPRSSSASIPSHHPPLMMDHSYSRQRKSNASDIGQNSGKIHRPNSSSGVCTSLTGSASNSVSFSGQNTSSSGLCERSRNTSECSVEDYGLACDCILNIAHCNDAKACCSSAYNSNVSIDGSTTSSLMEFHDPASGHHSHSHSHPVHPHLHHHSGEHLTLEPSISEEVDGSYNEELGNASSSNNINGSLTKNVSPKSNDLQKSTDTQSLTSWTDPLPASSGSAVSPTFKSHQSHVQHHSHQQQLDTLQLQHIQLQQKKTVASSDPTTTSEKKMHGPVRPPPKNDSQQSLSKEPEASKPVLGPARPPSKNENQQSSNSLSSASSSTSTQGISVHLPHLRSSRSGSISERGSCNSSTCCHHQHHHQTSPILSPKCTCSSCQNGMFQTLPTVPAGTDDDYLPMIPLNAAENAVSLLSNTASKPKPEEEEAYMIMAPQNSSQKGIGSKKNDCIFDGLTRAYSTGSKPKPLAPSIAAQCTVSTQTDMSGSGSQNDSNNTTASSRIRALSTGSHSLTFKAFRLRVQGRNKQKSLDSGCPRDIHNSSVSMETPTDVTTSAFSSSASSASLLDSEADNVSCNKNSKASSAPILSACINQRVRSATIGARPSPFGGGAAGHPNHQRQLQSQHHSCHHHNLYHSGKQHAGSLCTSQLYAPSSSGSHYSGSTHYLSSSQRKLNMRRHVHCCPPEPESDLMEITYHQKVRRDSCGEIIGSFEEESRRNRSRKSSTSTDNPSGPSNDPTEAHRRRSGSATASSFHGDNKNGQKPDTVNAGNNKQVGSFTKLDNIIQGIRNIGLHQKGSNNKNPNQKNQPPVEVESPLHQINTKPVKMNSMLKRISKEANRESLARQKSAEERERKLAKQALKNGTSPPPTTGTTAAKTDFERLTKKLKEKARQMDEENRKFCSSDEESPYVLVVPSEQLNTVQQNTPSTSQTGSTATANASANVAKVARKKSSVVRSFIPGFGSKDSANDTNNKQDSTDKSKAEAAGTSAATNSSSATTSSLTVSADSAQRKKSSTFSGKFKIGRPGSGNGSKKTSVSESEAGSRSPTSSPTPAK